MVAYNAAANYLGAGGGSWAGASLLQAGQPPTHLPYFALIPLVAGFVVHLVLMSTQRKESS